MKHIFVLVYSLSTQIQMAVDAKEYKEQPSDWLSYPSWLVFCCVGFFNGMEDYWNHTMCENTHCGKDFHDHTHHRKDVVRNASGIYSTMLLTQRAVDIVFQHDKNKVTKFAQISFYIITSECTFQTMNLILKFLADTNGLFWGDGHLWFVFLVKPPF